MPAGPRPQRQPTEEWDQLRLLVASPEQVTYELLRPVVLFGQSARSRARDTGVPERTVRRKVARFAACGMRSLFELQGEELTVEYAGDTLARYRVAYEADGRHLREASEPRLLATGHASPQPFLSPLEEVEWHPARRLAPYRPRRKRSDEGKQARLFGSEGDAAAG